MKKILLVVVSFSLILHSCSVLQTAENLFRLKFRIHSANSFNLSNVQLSNKKSIKDFSSVEMLKISSSLIQGKLPLSFNLNIEANNPNDGRDGFERTDISIHSFPWNLYIDNKLAVSGNIEKPVLIPGKGENTIFTLNVEFDLAKTIKEKNLDNILALVLKLGGVDGNTSNIKLLVKPVIGTPLGKLQYPDEITIIDKSF